MNQSSQGILQAIEPFVAPVPDLTPSVLLETVHQSHCAGFGGELLDHMLVKAADWHSARTRRNVNEASSNRPLELARRGTEALP